MDYQLIDFGESRKLERFGDWIIDRPSPAASTYRRKRESAWNEAHARFDAAQKQWFHTDADQSTWRQERRIVSFGLIEMPVAPTPFGHVGVFPEQHGNWQWLQDVKPRAEPSIKPSARNALNLFAYTGASTLALAKAGFEVVHVDAAKPNVQLARLAAEINGLKDHPIRYLVDDATKFATRELRRGNRYHTIVLDPPAYGHGPGGKAWRLERDVWPLLDYCIQLIENKFDYRLLITGHSPQVTADDVIDCLCEQLPRRHGCSRQQVIASTESGRMSLMDAQQRRLDAGFFVRTRFNSESASAESDTTY